MPIKVQRIPFDHLPPPPNRVEYGLNAPYNLYLNTLMEEVKEGWIAYQDDDDYYCKSDVFEKIVSKIKDNDNLILWNHHAPKKIVPAKENFGKLPVNCDIAGNAFMFHSKHKELAIWEPYRKGNWRVCCKLYKKLKPIWINELFCKTQIPIAGYGQRKDLPTISTPKVIPKTPKVIPPKVIPKTPKVIPLKSHLKNKFYPITKPIIMKTKPITLQTKSQIINHLITKFQFENYLEIGCAANRNFTAIRVKNKVGVDPVSGGTHRMYANEFFLKNTIIFDLIFIDGLHHKEQVLADIKNSLHCLNPKGMILIHDMLPTSELMQKVPRETKNWTGDGWKAFVEFRNVYKQFTCVIDTDFGLGFIRPNKEGQILKPKVLLKDLTWDNFTQNKEKWLGIISVENFINNL